MNGPCARHRVYGSCGLCALLDAIRAALGITDEDEQR